ncbi:DoxX family protein [Enterovibrio sp. ZSDZ42]|uniref:DoxX family protein n=1 Tax=Enterovibrio gelatinilyticus TaxID=2899819 RepID=A0ABT5R481_9GAMM|nr:DoxX family protein [Enterovibrio sp. ZSDZ42]MDD1795084.1 DoxX family protein [Enterovibrio sp. ZSDZ42]
MNKNSTLFANAAFALRIGLGLVFVIGGLSKLSLLLSSSKQAAMVANYMGTTGYINELFQDYLFSNGVLTPWLFLTSLSSFELFSGVALIAGFMVRPLALLYGFLLWTFVFSLPVDTVPGASVGVKTYTSPAMFVQIRDITLSGMMFVLFNLGAGARSLDARRGQGDVGGAPNWDVLGLLLRFSLGVTFIIGGFFGAYAKIPSFATYQLVLAAIGLVLIFGQGTSLKAAAGAVVLVMAWYMLQKFSVDKGVIANLNGVKREFALAAAGLVLLRLGGGVRFTLFDCVRRTKETLGFQTSQPEIGYQSKQ